MKVRCKACKKKFRTVNKFTQHECKAASSIAFAAVLKDRTAGLFTGDFDACVAEADRRVKYEVKHGDMLPWGKTFPA